MKFKKSCAVILSALIVSSAVLPPINASAAVSDTVTVFTDTVPDNSGYGISYVSVTNGTAHISLKAADKCTLLVGAYDVTTEQMLLSESTAVEKSENDTTIDISLDTDLLPAKFDIKCFLLSEDNSPLCDSYYVADVFVENEQQIIPDKIPLSHTDDKSDIIASGSCADDDSVLWELHSSGCLYLYGSSYNMYEYDSENRPPWAKDTKLNDQVTNVIVEDGMNCITSYAFSKMSNLRYAYIADTVDFIGDRVFEQDYFLHDVRLPEGSPQMGEGVFYSCQKLDNVKIPDMLILPENTFEYCDSLQNVTLPDRLGIIGKNAFARCQNLETISLPDSLAVIEDYAFEYCYSLSEINLPSSLERIGKGGFSDCISLKEISFPAALDKLGDYSFYGCSELSKSSFTDDAILSEIGEYAFGDCIALESFAVPDSVTFLGTGVFMECSNLSSVTLSGNTSFLPNYLFDSCKSLTSVIVPKGVKEIGLNAFINCSSLESVSLPDDLETLGTGVFRHCSSLDNVIIPDTVTNIDAYVFYDCQSLSYVSLPDDLTVIGRVFVRCPSLKTVILPSKLERIDTEAFLQCGIEYIAIPESVKIIDSYAFSKCDNLKAVKLPRSLIKVIDHAFSESNNIEDVYYSGNSDEWDNIKFGTDHGSLRSAKLHLNSNYEFISSNHYLDETNPLDNCSWDCGSNAKAVLYESGTLYIIGDGSMYDYTSDNIPWLDMSDKIERVVIEDGITYIGANAFRHLASLNSVYIGRNVKSIGETAFSDTALETVYVPKNVKTLREGVFSSCKNLTYAEIKSADAIADKLFYNCPSLTYVYLPENAASIGKNAFSRCSALVNINLPANLTSISEGAFSECSKLDNIVLPRGTSEVGQNAFQNCEGMQKIEIAVGTNNIRQNAFDGCEELKHVYYPMSEVYWGYINIESGNDTLLSAELHCEMTLEDSMYGHTNQDTPPSESGTISWGNSWELYEDGTLYIYGNAGSAAIPDYQPDKDIYAPWYDHKDKIKGVVIESGIKKIGRSSFYGLDNVTYVHIGSGVETLSPYCFAKCTSLENIELPSKITTIPANAFEGCTALTAINAYNVTMVQNEAFKNCKKLYNVNLSSSLTSLGKSVFYNCTNLLYLDIPDTLAMAGEDCFYNTAWFDTLDKEFNIIGNGILIKYNSDTENFKEIIYIPDGVLSIASKAFTDFYGIEAVQIPASVKTINANAFDIFELDSIYYLSSKSDWDKISIATDNDIITNCKNIYYNTYYSKESGTSHETEVSALLEKGTCGENLVWEMYSSGRLYIYGTGTMDDYSLSYNTLKLPPWYEKYTNSDKEITEIVIETGVESIGSSAFAQCGKCTNVTIPDTVEKIGESAFAYCTSLTEVVLPERDMDLGNFIFRGCTSLAKLDLSYITRYGKNMFNGCGNLSEVQLNSTAAKIPDYMFAGSGLSYFTIPSNFTAIGKYAFSECTNLSYVNIPSTVTEIGEYAFADCTELSFGFDGGDTTLTIGEHAFMNTKRSGAIVLTRDTNIGNYAFENCSELTSVVFHRGKINVGSHAFNKCTLLSNVTFSENAEYSFAGYTFNGCKSFTKVVIPASMKTVPMGLFSGDKGGNTSYIEKITISDGVTAIDDNALFRCTHLNSIEIPDSVTYIGSFAFGYCSSLTKITLPKNISKIADNSFYNCKKLESVVIPDNVREIGTSAFSGCELLADITLPEELQKIGNNAFSGCGISNTERIFKIEIPDSVTEIGGGAFMNTSISSVSLPSQITRIEEYTFADCNNLRSMRLHEGVEYIGDYAFNKCGSLKYIQIPKTITQIGYCATYQNAALTDVYYTGTKEQWKKIDIDETWFTSVYDPVSGEHNCSNAPIIYNSKKHYGSPMPTVFVTISGAASNSVVSNSQPTVTIKDLRPDTQYVLFAVYDSGSPLTEKGNLFYIDQQKSDSSGEIKIDDNFTDSVVIVAVGQRPDKEISTDKIISSADCAVIKPAADENPSFEANSANESEYTVSVVEWYLIDGENYPNLSASDKFEDGELYCVSVQFTPKEGYAFDENTVFTINGEAPDNVNGSIAEISYLAEKSDTEINTDTSTQPVTILQTADCTAVKPEAGHNPSFTAISADESKYTVSVIQWYLDDGENYPDISASDTFEEGKDYWVRIEFTPKDGFEFDENTVFKINGEEADIAGTNIAEVKYTAQKPDTDTKSDTDVKTDTDSKSDTDVKSDTDTKSDTDVKSDTDSKSDTDVKTDTDKTEKTGILGDVNRDGKVSASDSLLLQRYTIHLTTLDKEQLILGDVTADGKISGADCLNILRYSIHLKTNSKTGESITYTLDA